MKDRLYIAAKAPREELTKTRLGRAIGHHNAVALYKAFLSDLALRFADAPFALGWYITPSDAWTEIRPLFGHKGREARVSIQGEGDWTMRQRQLFRECDARGEERTVLIASDSPQITVGVVEEAFRKLERHDLVFGPTRDGGYYLIGMRGFHDVLSGVPMSTGTVLDDITDQAEGIGLSVARVETTFDVDEVEDLEQLRRLAATRPDLAATHSALEALGQYEDVRRMPNDPDETTSPEHKEESR